MNRKFLPLLMLLLAACQNPTPKPMGYVKVVYPEKNYTRFDEGGPYAFEYPSYAEVREDRGKQTEPWWYDIRFPMYDASIHLSYKPVNNNVDEYIEDSRVLVYKHTPRAEGINEKPFLDTAHNRYGIIYDLEGNVASAVQFFVTDSARHFVRGSLYFRTKPNRDSLNPVIRFLRKDIEHFIETITWKNE